MSWGRPAPGTGATAPASVVLTAAASVSVPVVDGTPYTLTTGGQACALIPTGGSANDIVTVEVDNSAGEGDAVTFGGSVDVFGSVPEDASNWRVTIRKKAGVGYDAVIAEPDA